NYFCFHLALLIWSGVVKLFGADSSAGQSRRQFIGARAGLSAEYTVLLVRWLCHTDARQVFDLPTLDCFVIRVSDPGFCGQRPQGFTEGLSGKSKTCRASAWHSQWASKLLLFELREASHLYRSSKAIAARLSQQLDSSPIS